MLLRAPRPELKREIMTFWRTYSGCLNTWFRGQGAMTSPRCYGGDFRGQGRFLLVTKKRCRCHIWNRSQRVHLLSVSCLHTQTYKHIHKEKTNSYTVMTNSTSLTIHCTDSQPGVLVQFIWKKNKKCIHLLLIYIVMTVLNIIHLIIILDTKVANRWKSAPYKRTIHVSPN